MSEPVVSNAADKGQVAAASKKEKYGRERQLDDWCVILSIPEGRRVIWQLLGKAKIHETIFETSSRIYYNAGQQDFGHYIMSEATEAQPDAFLKMMMEAQRDAETQNQIRLNSQKYTNPDNTQKEI